MRIQLHRDSGDTAAWRRKNYAFINELRRQFLIWRALTDADREEFRRYGEGLVEGRYVEMFATPATSEREEQPA